MFDELSSRNAMNQSSVRSLATYVLMLAAASALFVQPTRLMASDDALPTAEQILEQYVEATGGREAHNKFHNRIIRGTFEIVGMGMKAKMTVYAAAPQKNHMMIDSKMMGKFEAGTDGQVTWEVSAMMGPQVKEGEERAVMLREAMFNGHLHWRKLYKSFECVGMEDVDGKPCYKVVLTPEEGHPETQYFDKESHLLVKSETMLKTQMGTFPLVVRIADHKRFDGILIPHTIVQELGSIQKVKIVTESVEHNADIPADRFNIPADIQALLDKEKAAKEKPQGEAKKDG